MLPTEAQEQATLVDYLNTRNLKFFRVPNETFTRSWKQKVANKRLGVVPGVPDLFVIVGGRLIGIEMKRTKRSATTTAQLEWVTALNQAGIPTAICKGFDEAQAFIESIERGEDFDWSVHLLEKTPAKKKPVNKNEEEF